MPPIQTVLVDFLMCPGGQAQSVIVQASVYSDTIFLAYTAPHKLIFSFTLRVHLKFVLIGGLQDMWSLSSDWKIHACSSASWTVSSGIQGPYTNYSASAFPSYNASILTYFLYITSDFIRFFGRYYPAKYYQKDFHNNVFGNNALE